MGGQLWVKKWREVVVIAGMMSVVGANFCFAEQINWREEKSTHFIVYSAEDIEKSYVNKTIKTAEKYYHSLEEKLGFRRFDYWTWDNRLKIYIYPDKQSYTQVSNRPEWSAGSVNVYKKVINSYFWQDNFFKRLLPHELSHIVFHEYMGSEVVLPLWLDEGFACFNERSYYQRYILNVLQWAANGIFMDFDILNGLTQEMIASSPGAFYCYSVSLIYYLWQAFGKEKFLQFCMLIKNDDYQTKDALLDVYEFEDSGELTKEWLDYLVADSKCR